MFKYILEVLRKQSDSNYTLLSEQFRSRIEDQQSIQHLLTARLDASEMRLDNIVDQMAGLNLNRPEASAPFPQPRNYALDLTGLTDEQKAYVLGFDSVESREAALEQVRTGYVGDDIIIETL